jgi:hypothetical protein
MRYLLMSLLISLSFSGVAVPEIPDPGFDPLFSNLLDAPKASPLSRSFAGLVLGNDLDKANADLEGAWQVALGEAKALTPEVADAQFKWQMRTWVRAYYLFGPTGMVAPNRLSEANSERIESLLCNYAADKSRVVRADPKYVWFIQGSENHDMMDLGNAFLATQALANLPAYREKLLPDGLTPADHVAAWTAYFNVYCQKRFRNGLQIEFGSPTYGKYFIPELVNISDFAADPRLRSNARALLDIIWADWAVEQLGGVRGGAKARCYQGKYSQRGNSDSWYLMGDLLLRRGDWAAPGRYSHPIMGFGLVLATSGYALPPAVRELALHPEKRGEYAYISRRPGRMAHVDPLPPYDNQSCWYHLADAESRLLRYSWCTPDHILGSYTLDPALLADFQIYPNEPQRAAAHYAAISTQNLWQGLIFATGPDARIFPQCLGKPDKNKPDLSTTYVQQVAVQHENVMLFQANRNYPPIHTMRVYFGPGMKERLVERNGWRIIEEGNSYAAVRFFNQLDPNDAGWATWDDEHFLKAEDPFAPIAFVTGRKRKFASLDDFVRYLQGHDWAVENGLFTYTFSDRERLRVSMGLFVEAPELPMKNGVPLDLAPETYYDNPFFRVESGRHVVEVGLADARSALLRVD